MQRFHYVACQIFVVAAVYDFDFTFAIGRTHKQLKHIYIGKN